MNELNTLKQTEQGNRDSKGHCVQTCRSIKWMEWWRRNGNTSPPLYLRSALMEGGCYWEILSIVSWQLHIHGEKSKTTALCVKSTETPRYTCLFICTVSMNTHKIPTAEYRNGFVWCGATASDFNAVWGSTFVWMGLTAINWSSVLTVKSCPVLLSRKQTTKRETHRASYLCAWIFIFEHLQSGFFLLWNLNCLSKQGFLPLYVCVCFICSFMPPTVQWFSMKKNGTKGFPHWVCRL